LAGLFKKMNLTDVSWIIEWSFTNFMFILLIWKSTKATVLHSLFSIRHNGENVLKNCQARTWISNTI